MYTTTYFEKLKRVLSPGKNPLTPDSPGRIPTSAAFQETIKIERNRVNRNGGTFTIIVFDINGIADQSAFFSSLVECIAGRIRVSDKIGWYDHGRLGLILPETSTIGAKKLVQDLYKHRLNGIPRPPVEFYIYPFPQKELNILKNQ